MNSNRQYVEAQRQMSSLITFKKRAIRMAHDFGIADSTPLIELLDSQIADLSEELARYQQLNHFCTAKFPVLENISSLPRSLIEARIALLLSQTDLANQVGLKAQHIQRYEKCGYDSIALAKAIEIGTILQQQLSRRNEWISQRDGKDEHERRA